MIDMPKSGHQYWCTEKINRYDTEIQIKRVYKIVIVDRIKLFSV